MKFCRFCGNPILSPRAQRILEYIARKKEVNANDVIRELGMSITNANNYLRWLWDVGILEREARALKSQGGLHFIYRLKKNEYKRYKFSL